MFTLTLSYSFGSDFIEEKNVDIAFTYAEEE